MIEVLVSGCLGSMGKQVVAAVEAADDMRVVAGVDIGAVDGAPLEGVRSSQEAQQDPTAGGGQADAVCVYTDLARAIEQTKPDIMVDFTHPSAVAGNIEVALAQGLDCVIGTTGLSDDELARLEKLIPQGITLFVAPNFTTGAVLMMKFAQMAARYFPDCEIIEYHHNHKADSPSGTAVRTAQLVAGARDFSCTSPGKETEGPGCEGARGALVAGVPVHSVRSDGYVAHQEVILGSLGQTLTIRHDSHDRVSYMPGVLLAVREVARRAARGEGGLVVGLEHFMEG